MKSLFAAVVLGWSSMALAASSGDLDAGKAVFAAKCKTCHGSQGEGNAAIGKVLKAEIPDLRSKNIQSITDDQLKNIITGGTGKMKPVTGLSDKQVDDVIVFVRSLAKS